MRKVDITKKSNIKCEHCINWKGIGEMGKCILTEEKKYYYQRCKKFDWMKRIKQQFVNSKTSEVKE